MGMSTNWLIRKAKEEVIEKTKLDPEFVELHYFKREFGDAKFEFALYELDGICVEVTYRDNVNKWYFNFVRGLTDEEGMSLCAVASDDI